MGNTQHSKTGYFLFYYMKFPSLIYIIAYFSYNSNSFLKETSVLLNWLQFIHHISHFSHIIRMRNNNHTLAFFRQVLKNRHNLSFCFLIQITRRLVCNYTIRIIHNTSSNSDLCSSSPESFNTRLHPFSSFKPTLSKSSIAKAFLSLSLTPLTFIAKIIFSITLSPGNKLNG